MPFDGCDVALLSSNKAVVLQASHHYSSTNVDFGDTMIVASMELAGSQVLYSYDADFDRFSDLARRSPRDPADAED